MQVEKIAERVALNQSRFRQANEQLEQRADELVPEDGAIPCLCECPDPTCTELTRLLREQYESVRSRGEWFLVVEGHETCQVEGVEIAEVVERFPTYVLMEKVGEAAAVARELDPRTG
jgi:hypothetical protein